LPGSVSIGTIRSDFGQFCQIPNTRIVPIKIMTEFGAGRVFLARLRTALTREHRRGRSSCLVEKLTIFFIAKPGCIFYNSVGRLWYGEPDAVANAIGYTKFYSRSHNAVIRVYDETDNVIEMLEEAGDFKEW
jgi:hypothetical protein